MQRSAFAGFAYRLVSVSRHAVDEKLWTLAFSAAYVTPPRDQQHFTISEVAADRHELMLLQRIMLLSINRMH